MVLFVCVVLVATSVCCSALEPVAVRQPGAGDQRAPLPALGPGARAARAPHLALHQVRLRLPQLRRHAARQGHRNRLHAHA